MVAKIQNGRQKHKWYMWIDALNEIEMLLIIIFYFVVIIYFTYLFENHHILSFIVVIIIYFEKVHFFHAKLGLDVCPYEVPPHIP